MFRLSRSLAAVAFLAMAAVLGVADSAKAVTVTYSTTGKFTSSGTNVFTAAPGFTVTFNGATGFFVNVPPPSQASLGSFTTSALPTGSQTLSDTFTLTVTQTTPTPGGATFGTGTLTGTLSISATTGVISFAAPLTVTIDGVSYMIVSHDFNMTPGTLALVPPSGGGVATLQGQINTTPEPATLAMAIFGVPIAGLVALRRRRRNQV